MRDDEYMSPADAAQRLLPLATVTTVWRWCRYGVKCANGKRVRLRHVRIGGRIYTTAGWLEEFLRALRAADAARWPPNGGTPC